MVDWAERAAAASQEIRMQRRRFEELGHCQLEVEFQVSGFCAPERRLIVDDRRDVGPPDKWVNTAPTASPEPIQCTCQRQLFTRADPSWYEQPAALAASHGARGKRTVVWEGTVYICCSENWGSERRC